LSPSQGSKVRNLGVLLHEALVFVVCVKGVLVDQLRDRGSKNSPITTSQLLYHAFVLIDRRDQVHHRSLLIQKHLGALRIFFPHLSRNERRVYDNHVESAEELLGKLTILVEVIVDKAWILAKLGVNVEYLGSGLDLFVLEAEVDTGCGEEGALLVETILTRLALLSDLGNHEVYGGL